jgi:hypothetical protein
MLVAGAVANAVFYAFVQSKIAEDSGYGPRYNLPVVVPAAVGSGVFFATLAVEGLRGARYRVLRWLPAAVAGAAALFGVATVGGKLYPAWHQYLHAKHALQRAIERAGMHDAVVAVREGDLAMQAWDETQNLATDTDPPVLIVTDYGAGDDFECARRKYANRTWYRAKGWDDVELTPY